MTSTIDPTTSDSQSAKAIIQDTLDAYGLSSLASYAWNEFLQGTPESQIFLDIRNTPDYQARFPAMAQLAKSGQAITEAQYISYESSIRQINQAAGLPAGMYDTPQDIANLLTNNVSASEYQQRIKDYQTVAFQTPPEVKQALSSFYGADLTDGHLAAFFADPTRATPLIEQELAAATAAGAAQYTGFGAISQQQAEQLANLGVTQSQAEGGFSKLANVQAALAGLPGTGMDQIGTDAQLQAQFGQNAQDQAQIANRVQQVVNLGQEGGGPASSNQGAQGAGVAQP